ncbi:hypothetical protein M7I_5506 [Glarea lozoyensis 74030]|uniref:Uncharacterized protein n=1 Tax=Glarea lozoyensis (strain ATCC 74030 / MF5533) TaxID=1104152 RepID=H0ES31_GLAL7|nr:hypothetical protein M7I_5506 [Glarea lozoyensis 74030]
MVQRSSTYVVTIKSNNAAFSPLYGENSPANEDSDVLFLGMPNAVLKKLQVEGTSALCEADKEILAGLEKAGFKTDKGIDDSGIWFKYLQRGGGYYLDSGCSQLIADGKIAIKQGQEIVEVLPTGLKLTDGEILEADEIVWATGYGSMRSHCRTIFGDKVADQVHDVWGMDEEGEVRTIRMLALQIKAIEEGLSGYEDL